MPPRRPLSAARIPTAVAPSCRVTLVNERLLWMTSATESSLLRVTSASVEPACDDADDALPVDRAATEHAAWRIAVELQAPDDLLLVGAEHAVLASVDAEAAHVETAATSDLDTRFGVRSAAQVAGQVGVTLDDLFTAGHRRLRSAGWTPATRNVSDEIVAATRERWISLSTVVSSRRACALTCTNWMLAVQRPHRGSRDDASAEG